MRRSLLLLPLTGLCLADPGAVRRDTLDFRYDILPILQRQGCGSAYCHGSATGRGGFKLSLFASDPAADHAAITAELGGRRLDLRRPEHSLLLRKPARQLDHGGGRKLPVGSPGYQAVREWIAAGAPFAADRDRHLLALELTRDGDRLRATARFRDAHGTYQRDVTELCTFTTTDDRVVGVDRQGRLRPGAAGEAWVFARYVTRSARLPVARRFAAVPPAPTPDHALDRVWQARLQQLGLVAAPPAPAATLARRLYLDLVDRLPTPAELRAFLDRPAATRVAATAAALVRSDDFASKFGRHLAQWLEIPLEPAARPDPRAGMFAQQHQQLVAAVRRGDRLQAIAERLLVADRALLQRFTDPRDRSELVGRAWLGIRIGCARCHNSPVDRWEQRDHLAFSALFADARPDPEGGMRSGLLFDPDTGAAVTPRTLPVDATVGAAVQRPDHPQVVADFVVRGGHGLFARNIANRVFAVLMGRGLVDPPDDHRLTNPAVHEPLLAHLASVADDGDLRRLVLHIVGSALYQTDSTPGDAATDDAAVRLFARRSARVMPPATFANAVARALGTRPAAGLTRSPLARQLALLNSGFLHDAVAASEALDVIELVAPDRRARVRDLFLLLLSREPRPAEVAAILQSTADPQGNAVEDLAFALLASREFGSIR